MQLEEKLESRVIVNPTISSWGFVLDPFKAVTNEPCCIHGAMIQFVLLFCMKKHEKLLKITAPNKS